MKKDEYIVCRDLLCRLRELLPGNCELIVPEDTAKMIERLCQAYEIKVSAKRKDGSSIELRSTSFSDMSYDGHTYKVTLSIAGAYILMSDLFFLMRGCYKFTKLPETPENSFFNFLERCKEWKKCQKSE